MKKILASIFANTEIRNQIPMSHSILLNQKSHIIHKVRSIHHADIICFFVIKSFWRLSRKKISLMTHNISPYIISIETSIFTFSTPELKAIYDIRIITNKKNINWEILTICLSIGATKVLNLHKILWLELGCILQISSI